jgi:hypothetical protein
VSQPARVPWRLRAAEWRRQKAAEWRRQKAEAGLCTRCGTEPARPEKASCAGCAHVIAVKRPGRRAEARRDGRCVRCLKRRPVRPGASCSRCRRRKQAKDKAYGLQKRPCLVCGGPRTRPARHSVGDHAGLLCGRCRRFPVLAALHEHGDATVYELAAHARRSVRTCLRQLRRLEVEGLIVPRRRTHQNQPKVYRLNRPERRYA